MANLFIPISINENGVLETTGDTETQLMRRLEFFLLSGIKKHISLPTPGIEIFWSMLMTIGPSSKFTNEGVLKPQQRREIQKSITKEVNQWLVGDIEILDTEIVGNPHEQNGIKFVTIVYEYLFTFEFVIPNKYNKTPTIGNWLINGYINVRN